jgi:hypothetical protein
MLTPVCQCARCMLARMTNKEIGQKLVDLCKANKNEEAMKTLYASDIVSVEAMAPPGQSTEVKGLPACAEKGKMWAARMEVHGAVVEGPFTHGSDKFAVFFDYDVTEKAGNKRFHMKEVGIYTVKNDKITREEFYYSM